MPRANTESESLSPDDGLSDGLELRRNKSVRQRCERKKARSVRKGIESYFERRTLKHQLGDDIDDDDIDNGLDELEEDDNWYH